MIDVRLFATLRQEHGRDLTVESEGISTVRDVIDRLDIAPGEVSIVLVNGRHKSVDMKLEDGDKVSLIPPVGGG